MSRGLGPVAGPAGVTALDHLAERLVESASNLRVVVATTAAERDAGFRLRYRQVVDQGWAPPDELPEGMERDAYDADALQICAWSGETFVGTIRVVLPAAGRRLPVETDFDLDIEPIGAVVEIGRLVIDPMYRGDPIHRAWGA